MLPENSEKNTSFSISNRWLALIVVLVAGLGLTAGYILIPLFEPTQTASMLVPTNNTTVNNTTAPLVNTTNQNTVQNTSTQSNTQSTSKPSGIPRNSSGSNSNSNSGHWEPDPNDPNNEIWVKD